MNSRRCRHGSGGCVARRFAQIFPVCYRISVFSGAQIKRRVGLMAALEAGRLLSLSLHEAVVTSGRLYDGSLQSESQCCGR